MKDLAPEIVRKRLLIEGYFTNEIDQKAVENYLTGLPAHLNLRIYGEPIVFAPSSGMGKDENVGFDGFIPLIDSGISIYIWSEPKFFSVIAYTCKDFDIEAAKAFTKDYFAVDGPMEFMSF